MRILESVKTQSGKNVELIGEQGSDNILVIGVFHGDEPQGKILIERYLENYDSRINSPTSKSKISRWGKPNTIQDKERNILFIPCLNPDGLCINSRTNANGVDLNRNFPTKNWGKNEGNNATCDDCQTNYYGGIAPASEVETKFVIDIIEKYSPKLILTLHAPYKVVNYDGPAQEVAEVISEIIGYPTEASIGYPTPGSFGTYAGVERNIPTITLELDDKCDIENLVEPVFEIFNMLQY